MDKVDEYKILMCDYKNVGHHWIYNYTVMKNLSKQKAVVYFTSNLDDDKKNLLDKDGIEYIEVPISEEGNKFSKEFKKVFWVKKCLRYSSKNNFNLIHFFTLDFIILQILLLKTFYKTRTTATIHWTPGNKVKLQFLKLIMKSRLSKLLVHGDYIKLELEEKLNIKDKNKIVSITYPSLTTSEIEKNIYKVQEKSKDSNEIKTLLYFGEMRYDKGVDILLESLKHVRQPYNIIIAGKPMHFSKEYITDIAKQNKNIMLDLGFVTDENLEKYFEKADIVVLPYRKMFGGQSGPLTDGVKHNCIIIAPNVGQIGYTVQQYGIGNIFEPENIKDLANVIDDTIVNYDNFMIKHRENFEKYNMLTSEEYFAENYLKFVSEY